MIIVSGKYTPRDISRAATKRVEFKPNRYTSGSANLDNMIALDKAVILCPAHTRKFDPKAARYRAHPDKKLRRVVGRCDVCQELGLSFLFLNERDAEAQQRIVERAKRAMEYGRFYSG